MITKYGTVALMTGIGLIISIILVMASYKLAIQKPDTEKTSPYECGFQPHSDARTQFQIKFFLVAILFLIFDLEITMIIPFTLIIGLIGPLGFMIVSIFIGVLSIGLIYEWRSGALDWQ